MKFKENIVTMNEYSESGVIIDIKEVETYKSFTKLKDLMDKWHDCPDLEELECGCDMCDHVHQDEVEDALLTFVKDWDYEKRVQDSWDAAMEKEMQEQNERLEQEESEFGKLNYENDVIIELLRNKYPELLETLLEESDGL